MHNPVDWGNIGAIMDCPTKRSWQTQNAGCSYCQLDLGMVNYRMAILYNRRNTQIILPLDKLYIFVYNSF